MATWKVVNMEHVVADGGVVTVHWQAVETDGDYNARTYSSMNFTYDASAPDFVPYADLTEAEVIQWVKDAMGAEEVALIDAKLAEDLANQKAPTEESGVPW